MRLVLAQGFERTQVHAGVEQRLAQTLEPAACVLQGQVVRDVFGLLRLVQIRYFLLLKTSMWEP